MPIGIRLLFRKDLGFQFETHPERFVDCGFANEHLQVLGSMDYVNAARLENLDEVILPPEDARIIQRPTRTSYKRRQNGKVLPVGGANDTILFPLCEERLRESQIDRAQKSITDCDMVSITRLTLSSLAFDYCKLYDEKNRYKNALKYVGRLLPAARDCLAEAEVDSRAEFLHQFNSSLRSPLGISYWSTLGGPDIVCLAFPKTPDDLAYLNVLIWVARSVPIYKLLRFLGQNANKFDGHAFASVQSNLCYEESAKFFANAVEPPFVKRESQLALRYPCRISVGPGHELDVLDRITQNMVARKVPRSICGGHRSIQITYDHLSDLLTAIREGTTPIIHPTGNRVRATEVATIRSTVAWDAENIKPSLLQYKHKPGSPSLSREISGALASIRNRFHAFGGDFMGEAQHHALMQLCDALDAAFRRNDRASGVRDLLPVFDQLARAFGERQLWKDFYESLPTIAIAQDFGRLFNHLWIAIRNRIEQRGEPGDPIFPNTIEYGASKMVNAYSVACWIACNTLLNKHDCVINEKNCANERFAVAVRAGNEGAVRVVNIFSGLTNDDTHPIISAAADGRWNAQLLLLSISGPALMRPELAFALCIHDIAEFSNWTRLESAAHLNATINLRILQEFCGRLQEEIELLRRDRNLGDLYTLAEQTRDTSILMMLLLMRRQKAPRGTTFRDLVLRERSFHETQNVHNYFKVLVDCLQGIKKADINDAIASLDGFRRGGIFWPPWGEDLVYSNSVLVGRLRDVSLQYMSLQSEILADLAMCLVLMHILEEPTPDAMLKHIDHLFCGVLETSAGWSRPALSRQIRDVAFRWAFMLACFADCSDSLKMQELIRNHFAKHEQRLNKRLDPSGTTKPFDPDSAAGDDIYCYSFIYNRPSLASELNQAIKDPNSAPKLWNFRSLPVAHEIIDDFARVWKESVQGEGKTSTKLDLMRYDFVQLLWGKAQLFRVITLFDIP